MNKLTLALAAGFAAAIASSTAFANMQGGLDTKNPVYEKGAIANQDNLVAVPFVNGPSPTVSVHALTGGPRSDPTDESNFGRFTGITG